MLLAFKNLLPRYFSFGNRRIFILGLMVLFWGMYDNIVQYLTPILIMRQGYSITVIGLIIGSSSIAGALFDFFICRVFKNTDFRRIFLAMFAVCLFYPLLLWQANSIWLWLLAMAVWGLYYDLLGFGVFDYVGRHTLAEQHSSSFGVVQIFKSIAGVVAPIIIGLLIAENFNWQPFALMWIFLFAGFIFFIQLFFAHRKKQDIVEIKDEPKRNIWVELKIWKKLWVKLLPVLSFTLFIFVIDAFFWTLAPLYGQRTEFYGFGGLFLAAYILPFLIIGWFVGPINKKFGKKRTAFVSMLIWSILMSVFFIVADPWWQLILVFVSALFISLSLPSINGAYADYISEAPIVEGQIQGLEDFAFNIGYVIGPILAGILADIFNISVAFSILGLCGLLLAVILLKVTPTSIVVKVKRSDWS